MDYKLKAYSTVIERRRSIARIYQNRLSTIPELVLPPGPPDVISPHFDVYQNYELLAERRDELRDFLRDASIGTLIQWGGKAIHQWDVLGFKNSFLSQITFLKSALCFQ